MMQRFSGHYFALSLFIFSFGQAQAEACSAQSRPNIVPLLELYTSEGCSSCPPADQWLSQLDTQSAQVTPLAFHVDYWNYIGWQDRFSKPQYSNRQRQLAKLNGAGFVYTPQFVLNGRDFKGWNSQRLGEAASRFHQQPAKLQLELKTVAEANGDIQLNAIASAQDIFTANRAEIYIALFENKLVSNIKAGENNGRELHHDYVVRDMFGGFSMPQQLSWQKRMRIPRVWQQRDGGAVMFVQDKLTGEVLQSLALRFCH